MNGLIPTNQLKTIKDVYHDYKTDPNKLPRFKNTLKNVVYSDPTSNKVFLKLFVFSDKFTKDRWRADRNEIENNLRYSLGHPLAVAADSKYLFAHPGSTKLGYSQNENIQKPFIIGKDIGFVEEPKGSSNYFSIYEIIDKTASEFLKEISGDETIPIPFFSSPQIVYKNTEDDSNIKRFKIQHNILTDNPQFGEKDAIAKDLCIGNDMECLPILQRQASSNNFDSILLDTDGQCDFCLVGRLTQIFENNLKTVQHSSNHFKSDPNYMSEPNTQQTNDNNNNNQQQQGQNQTDSSQNQNLGQPIKTNNNNPNNLDTKIEETKTGYKLDIDTLNNLIKKNIDEFMTKKNDNINEQTKQTKNEETSPSTKTEQGVDEATRKRLEEVENNNKELTKQVQEYQKRFYRDDVANVLLEYYKTQKAFVNDKGELDESRFGKALEYWTNTGKDTKTIQEEIEISNLMFSHQLPKKKEKEAEITKKASSKDFEGTETDTQVYNVPETQKEESQAIESDDKPYWDRSIATNSI